MPPSARQLVGAAVLCILTVGGCDRRITEPTDSHDRDPDTLRIVCDISPSDTNYFDLSPAKSPLQIAMAGSVGGPDLSDRAGSAPQIIVAYPENFSVRSGEDVELHYAAELVPVGNWLAVAEVFDSHSGRGIQRLEFKPHQKPLVREACASWYDGCAFSKSLKIDTAGLLPGMYHVFLTDNKSAQSSPVYFHIRPQAEDVTKSDVVIILSELTWHAYNFYGGGSLYGIQRLDEDGLVWNDHNYSSHLYAASTRRPLLSNPSRKVPDFDSSEEAQRFFSDPANLNLARPVFKNYADASWIRTSPEAHLIPSRFLRENQYRTITVAQADLEAEPTLLKDAKIVLLTGHNEYWTSGMYAAMNDYVMSGGRVANFSGNLMWWQINLVNGTIYQDQIGHSRSAACKKHLWKEFHETGLLHVLREMAPDQILGVNYRFANYPLSYVERMEPDQLAALYGITEVDKVDFQAGQGLVVRDADHPVFAGMSVRDGERIGSGTGVMAVELDAAPLSPDGGIDRNWPNKIPGATRVLGSTSVFVATLIRHPSNSNTYVGIKEAGVFVETAPAGSSAHARVVSFGSIGFVFALAAKDPDFEALLLNTMEYLSAEELPPVPDLAPQ